ncbi:MAG: electron transfer flavoprotein subunit alpha/FixB family protein [bacterium]
MMKTIEHYRNGEVWVFAEEENGRLCEAPIELLGKGRELADELGVRLGALLLGGRGTEELVNRLGAYGADKIYLVEDAKLRHYQTAPFCRVMARLCGRFKPQIVLYGATPTGRDLAPSVAGALGCGLTADCTDLRIGDYRPARGRRTYEKILLQIRPTLGGSVIATVVNCKRWPQMATVREGVMVAPTPNAHRRAELVRCEAGLEELTPPVRIIESHRGPRRPELRAARVVVAGGAGVGTRENFKLIWELANCLGGAVGCSRAAVDLGFVDKAYLIGQTGVSVRPALYIACGISGAEQHRAGMEESAKIVAVNIDPRAPIFEFADYGIVGDLTEVIPRMIKTIRGGGPVSDLGERSG